MTFNASNIFKAVKAIDIDVRRELGPPEEGLLADSQVVVPRSIVRGTRGYIEKVANQANGCYEKGWYDACAVMVRRLIETLIIEAFEKHLIAHKIQNTQGDFLYLRDLINCCLAESTWNLSRNCKQALPKLKDIGDKSAHSRRFIAQRGDLDPNLSDIRLVVQELIYLSGLK
ncbi:hypothetical protein [Candidatus Nitrotoga sp. AM1P]|uniref:hypothetical protein n=1 Tax=Candidatus Nitrotoga sp. AM1P TaxID=2559597 RepID=UPI0010B5AE8D|nr:hypothetical protein [Candidatus Nitrotoga sp. AM1P]BBJ23782.1 hypothetical protein W01_17090 [Candidatus Nitrotoga sp. AM1P]